MTDEHPMMHSVGEGWHSLVRPIVSIVGIENVSCIKEKFGMLRVYYKNAHKLTQTELDAVECLLAMSVVTCEVCGDAGFTREKDHYMKTVCDKHAKGYK